MQAVPEVAESVAEVPAAELPRYIFVKGQTDDGRKFRPSDWADRLLGCISVYAREETEQFHQLADTICLTQRDGIRGVLIDRKMAEIEPMMFRFVNNFAASNKLVIEELGEEEWNNDHRRVVVKPRRSFS